MKLAIIGMGMAAKPHIAALEELSDRISISGLYMRNEEKRKAAADALGTKAFASIDAIAEDDGTDAALILTPPNARKEIIAKLSAAGKHLLMEKPLERSLDAANELVALAEATGIVTGTVFQHRARQGSLHLSQLLADGALGEIAMVRTNVPWWRPQSYYDEPGRGTYAQDGGGVLITQAIHVLDLMLSLCGPVRAVQAMLATTALHKMETEDFATAGVIYENGAVGSICATTAGFPGDAESIYIDGSKGSAILEAGHLTLRWRDGKTEEFGEESASGGSGDPMAFPCAWHKAIIENFADCVDGTAEPICSWRDALEVQKLLDGITRSSKLDGQRVLI
ncbi:Predicted dehydrogenase [Cohaesibacter sp. ES.047]|uniref:Gfo/Idh/MocA family protein n=1 Tax=Cohaesibacter sp. ES.047 TaxID=1798205 RepID=UPI000BB6CF3F|nr:Gfo/Idh/MocA family oxidoreductase [Cohaesibacter sp. ES.047]SNY92679.1 Predicted dehydrogenase [Cohaesibacter sp. ES.047]